MAVDTNGFGTAVAKGIENCLSADAKEIVCGCFIQPVCRPEVMKLYDAQPDRVKRLKKR
jgi:hypothetical protein